MPFHLLHDEHWHVKRRFSWQSSIGGVRLRSLNGPLFIPTSVLCTEYSTGHEPQLSTAFPKYYKEYNHIVPTSDMIDILYDQQTWNDDTRTVRPPTHVELHHKISILCYKFNIETL